MVSIAQSMKWSSHRRPTSSTSPARCKPWPCPFTGLDGIDEPLVAIVEDQTIESIDAGVTTEATQTPANKVFDHHKVKISYTKSYHMPSTRPRYSNKHTEAPRMLSDLG